MSRKRRPFVAVETDVAKDESFAVLADICGYGRDEALGRIIRLWAWCADRRLTDAPIDCPGYAVPRGVIERFLGPHGIDGILGGGVDEFALGREFRDGLIYLRGTDVTVASMRARSAGSVTGGQTRAREVLATSSRGPNGEFVAQLTFNQHERGETTTVTPPITTVDPRSQIPDPRSGSENSADGQLDSRSPPELVLSSDSQANPPKQKRVRAIRVAAHRMPPDWAPRQQELDKAAAMHVQVPVELERFRDHHTAKGSTFVDWDAAFRTWLGNAARFANGTQNGRSGPLRAKSPIELQMERIAMLEAQERAGNQ